MSVDKVFGPVDIAMSGLRAHGRSMEVISSNVANARTTDTGKGVPYRRLEAMFKAESEGISDVAIDDIVEDMSQFNRVLSPGHPEANEQGYVTMPNVQLPIEMMNLTIAARAYQANAAILKRYQQMMDVTLELLR
jgi:flagellar basal-body rod protein FlgC